MAQGGRKMASRWPQDGPKWPQDGPRRSQDGPRWPEKAANSFRLSAALLARGCDLGSSWADFGFQDGPKMASKWPQDGPTWQDGFEIVQDGPKMDPRCPRWLQVAQDGPTWCKMLPRWLQDGPRWPQDGLKMASRWPQEELKMVYFDPLGEGSGPKK